MKKRQIGKLGLVLLAGILMAGCGKTKEEATHIVDNYMHMIYEKEYDPELLEEAIAFKNTHKQANRIKCATLGWTGFLKLLEGSEE